MNEPARTLLEAAVVGALVLAAGLAANAVHPDGLSLTRDYFRTAMPTDPGTVAQATAAGAAPAAAVAAPGVPGAAAAGPADAATAETVRDKSAAPAEAAPVEKDPALAAVVARLQQHGLQVVGQAEAVALFEDPACAAGAYVFVDARADQAYLAGHIPGAVQFDRYHPERYVADVLAACAGALQIVVYCNGQDCEDSELAALELPAFGIDPRLIRVYPGGFTAWSAAGLPVERGPRGGGGG